MPKERENYVTDASGDQCHPAFGMARVSRVHAHPGEVLFQSDVRHGEYIMVTISEATRRRELSRDWVHAGRQLVQVSMSLAQWASLVASAGTEGVPVTIDYDHGDRPGLVMESRLALTTGEVRAAADAAFAKSQEALAAYEAALTAKAPAAERNRLLRALHAAIANASPNVEYAARQLTEHAEAVVEKSRADIEAMIRAGGQDGQQAAGGTGPVISITDGPS
jgi:hypothetical protein